jgi:hypothetical protein
MVARKGAGMYPQVVRPGPLNVLAVLADDALDVAPLLGAFRGHCALVCTSPAQGVEAARRFEADVALIDLRAPDPAAVARALAAAGGARPPVFVALAPAAGPAPAAPPGFVDCLPLPASAGELEQLLWRVGRAPAAGAPGPAARPGGGATG